MRAARLGVALALALIVGCDDGSGPLSARPSATPEATLTSSPTPVPPITPTPTATEHRPTCCEGVNYCRGTGPGAGFFCSANETSYDAPYQCAEETSRCALPTATPTLTRTVATATITLMPTLTPTILTPTRTLTPAEFHATCCQSYSEDGGCYRPDSYDRFCDYPAQAEPFGAPYRCNAASHLCEIPPTARPCTTACDGECDTFQFDGFHSGHCVQTDETCVCVADTPTVTPTPTVTEEDCGCDTPTMTPTQSGVCGNGFTEGNEACDVADNYGGDGCAANCQLEDEVTLHLGGVPEHESFGLIQTGAFSIEFPLSGDLRMIVGRPSSGAHGVDHSFYGPTDLPIAIRLNGLAIEPSSIPGLACICVRGVELQSCGGRAPALGDSSNICNRDASGAIEPTVCSAEDSCRATFGPGIFAAGRAGCAGVDGAGYSITLDHSAGAEQVQIFDGVSGPAAVLDAYVALGIIAEGPCAIDVSAPGKGADGIPCTDDDPESSRGQPQVLRLTTSRAEARLRNANGIAGWTVEEGAQCGARPCVVSAEGALIDCDELRWEHSTHMCLALANPELDVPQVGDMVLTARLCGLDDPSR